MTIYSQQAMINAWAHSRAAAKTYGGSVRSYFAEALRQAWAKLKSDPMARATAELCAEIRANKGKPPVDVPAHIKAAASRSSWSHDNAGLGLAHHGW